MVTDKQVKLTVPGEITNLLLDTSPFQWPGSVKTVFIHVCKHSHSDLGPVVQSIVSLTSSLRVILLTVLADSIYNILIFFAEKM